MTRPAPALWTSLADDTNDAKEPLTKQRGAEMLLMVGASEARRLNCAGHGRRQPDRAEPGSAVSRHQQEDAQRNRGAGA